MRRPNQSKKLCRLFWSLSLISIFREKIRTRYQSKQMTARSDGVGHVVIEGNFQLDQAVLDGVFQHPRMHLIQLKPFIVMLSTSSGWHQSHFFPRIWNVGMGSSGQSGLSFARRRSRQLLFKDILSSRQVKPPSSNIFSRLRPEKVTKWWAKANSSPTKPFTTSLPLSVRNLTLGASMKPQDRLNISCFPNFARSANSPRNLYVSHPASRSFTKIPCLQQANLAFTLQHVTVKRPSSRTAGKAPGRRCTTNSWLTRSKWIGKNTANG